MATYAHTRFAKPVPMHALTEAAEAAREALRSLDPHRLTPVHTPRGTIMEATRKLLTRAEVEAAYVHPAPEEAGAVVALRDAIDIPSMQRFIEMAEGRGADVEVTVARGTTPPKWHVNAPDSKPNPGPPVEASQYHGELVDSVVVWARRGVAQQRRGHRTVALVRVRAEWHNGRVHEVTVNGAASSLKAALEALEATS